MATLLCYGTLLSYALPSASADSLSVGNSTASYATVSDNPAFDTNYRSTVEIVWSCLTVVFASSWLCVHPNVTGYNTTMWHRLRERFKLFALAVFAPELLAVFAFYQWWGCRKLYQSFKKKADELRINLRLGPGKSESLGPGHSQPFWKRIPRSTFAKIKAVPSAVLSYGTRHKGARWSYTHAHFVQMGGIVLRDDNGNVGFKKPEDWELKDIKTFFAMQLSEAEIRDKSKAGVLAKTLVAARVIWFLIQTIARAVQGLPIALLEVASLAFISFHLAMYVFWWHKPLDIEYPLEMSGVPGEENHGLEIQIVLVLFVLLGCLDAVPIGLWIYSSKRQRYPRLYSFGKRLTSLHAQLSDVTEEVKIDFIFNLAIAVTSSSFGAFHAIGWQLPAPSEIERMLWRISCLGLILYPLVLFATLILLFLIFMCVSPIISTSRYEDTYSVIILGIFIVLGILGGIFYVGARLTIMFLPFFELRDLPPLVHRTVSWSRFLNPV